jgi:sugar phosphate isomerase/epimerase
MEGARQAHQLMPVRLALHTWTLDTTPLARALEVVRDTGWSAIELRRLDFVRAEAGVDVVDLVRQSGVPAACVGLEMGWMFALGPERARLLEVADEQCARAAALGSPTVMSPTDAGRGEPRDAAAAIREIGDIAASHGVRVALEANSQAAQLNTLPRLRELLALAGHPRCGILLDTYHLVRSGDGVAVLEDLRGDEIVHVQYSDVPAVGLEPGKALDRLPPGRGIVPFKDVFRLLEAKGYAGYASYEAPNPAAWARDPVEVAWEALQATRVLL